METIGFILIALSLVVLARVVFVVWGTEDV